jgi:hypothetical protein
MPWMTFRVGRCRKPFANGTVRNVAAMLREIAQIEVYRVRSTVRRLGQIVAAEPEVEFTDEHRSDMRARLSALVSGTLDANRTATDEATGEKPAPSSEEENAA